MHRSDSNDGWHQFILLCIRFITLAAKLTFGPFHNELSVTHHPVLKSYSRAVWNSKNTLHAYPSVKIKTSSIGKQQILPFTHHPKTCLWLAMCKAGQMSKHISATWSADAYQGSQFGSCFFFLLWFYQTTDISEHIFSTAAWTMTMLHIEKSTQRLRDAKK